MARNTNLAKVAQDDLRDATHPQAKISSESLGGECVPVEPISPEIFDQLIKIDRYERRALSKNANSPFAGWTRRASK